MKAFAKPEDDLASELHFATDSALQHAHAAFRLLTESARELLRSYADGAQRPRCSALEFDLIAHGFIADGKLTAWALLVMQAGGVR